MDMVLNLGDVLTLGGGVAALAVAWGMMRASLTRMDEKIGELQSHRDKHDHRLRNVEQGHIAIVTEIKSMAEMLREVRDTVRARLS